jgi:hypothetical protein
MRLENEGRWGPLSSRLASVFARRGGFPAWPNRFSESWLDSEPRKKEKEPIRGAGLIRFWVAILSLAFLAGWAASCPARRLSTKSKRSEFQELSNDRGGSKLTQQFFERPILNSPYSYPAERHLLYVACTRARDQLLGTGVAPESEFLSDFSKYGISASST